MVDHWLSLAHKNKWQSGFTKCVTIDYSTFNYMKSGLQIKLEIIIFGDKDFHILNVFVQLK
jgi:hypothetical protein